MKLIWSYLSTEDLKIEKLQLKDEGKDLRSVEKEFEFLLGKDVSANPVLQKRAEALLDKTVKLPAVNGYPFKEPSDLKGIRGLRSKGKRKFKKLPSDKVLLDKVTGAWLGRCAGCMLGKPVEGRKRKDLWPLLRELNEFPLKNYMSSDIPAALIKKYNIDPNFAWINRIKRSVEDDDTNYTVTGFAVMKQYGKDFKPEDMAMFWMQNIPYLHLCTAERVAYKNFTSMELTPPGSAVFRNPYREWIGAQIRGDFFGYAAMGNPEKAAEYAWRDASISHVKNGIYGEMWVAAMLASAAVLKDVKAVIEAGLSEIPKTSRLYAEVKDVIAWKEEGILYSEAIERIHGKWDENLQHHWCHTNSNAQIVAMGLLWSEGDFEKAICRAVEACFDTDCNGATVGSVMGMMLGGKKLPKKWTKPLNNELETGIAGYYLVKITDIAKEGFELFKNFKND
ncbi:MAG: ADP-ribosylglycohydrolase family protein [Candidatus Firestonebacteria bacterium]